MKLTKVQTRRTALTDAQVLEVARRYFGLGETQAALAWQLGLSPSYLARLLRDGRGRVFDVKVVAR